MPSLTHTEAQRRASLIRVAGYDVHLDLTRDGDLFGSTTTIEFSAEPGSATFLDVAPHELVRAQLNGRDLDPATLADGRLPLAGLDEHNTVVVAADMAYSHDGEGLHKHVDPADGKVYLYAMSFLDAAPRWFACFDQPDLKAPYAFTVDCPPDWTVVGNAPAQRDAAGRWRMATEHPLATYFTTLVAGPYHSVTAEHDGIPLGLHARASLATHLDTDAVELLDLTARFLDEYHRLFGVRYPWGEYHQAFVPDFNAGAMENPGCVTLRDSYVFRSRVTEYERGERASTVSHEMAHMWFGDLVTMRWWDDLWLNESFAEYVGYRVSDRVSDYPSWVHFGAIRKSWGYTADRRPSTHPVAGNGAADAKTALSDFDGISYAKGAAVLRQLGAHLGDDVMLGGLRDYFRTHAYGNASFGDLIQAWTAAGAHDIPAWADAWLRTSGVDTLRASVEAGAVRVDRSPPDGQVSAARPHTVSVATYDGEGRELERASAVVLDPITVRVEVAPVLALPDAADETWAKTALDPDAWQRMPLLLPAMKDPLARVAVWNALRLAVADAELDPALALAVVEAAAPTEPSEVVIGTVLPWAVRTLAGTYIRQGADRSAALARLAAAAHDAMTGSVPASGHQLAAARAYVSASRDRALLQAWLRDESLPAGLAVDDELRWAVLERLACLGVLDAAATDAELERDNSTQGALHAARCRSLMPDPQAKHDALQAMLTDPRRSNHELYAIADGFWHPEQTELTTPFVSRYFDGISATARLRYGWVVARLALLAYPRTAVERSTLSQGEALLRSDDLDAGIRRSIVDAADDLRRAVVARERFG